VASPASEDSLKKAIRQERHFNSEGFRENLSEERQRRTQNGEDGRKQRRERRKT
jgi:hypothetical protein